MARNKKYWQRRFGILNTEPYHHHFDLRQIPDLDDEGFAYLLTYVMGINMLDLNETDITNASIALYQLDFEIISLLYTFAYAKYKRDRS
jgi:hypothetical protein